MYVDGEVGLSRSVSRERHDDLRSTSALAFARSLARRTHPETPTVGRGRKWESGEASVATVVNWQDSLKLLTMVRSEELGLLHRGPDHAEEGLGRESGGRAGDSRRSG